MRGRPGKARKTKKSRSKAAKATRGRSSKSKKASKSRKTSKGAAKRKTSRKRAPARKSASRKTRSGRSRARKEVFGEGNYTASREFRREETGFVQRNRDRIPRLGEQAAEALDGSEGNELRQAEETARSHSAGGDHED